MLIKYIRETIHLPPLVGWIEHGVMIWSIDAALVVHNDMKSHIRACLTTVKGSMINLSMMQNIYTKSSTEAELVGVDDATWKDQHHSTR